MTAGQRQPDNETIILRRYKAPVLKELDKLRTQRALRSVCRDKLGGLNPARLTEILNDSRELTAYYMAKLLQGGVVSIEQILQGKRIEDLPADDQKLLKKLKTKDEDIDLIWRAEQQGVDWRQMLKLMLGDKE